MAQMKDVSLFHEMLKQERAQTTADITRSLLTTRTWNDDMFQKLVLLRCQVDALQRIIQHESQGQEPARDRETTEETRPGPAADHERREGQPPAKTTVSQERTGREDP